MPAQDAARRGKRPRLSATLRAKVCGGSTASHSRLRSLPVHSFGWDGSWGAAGAAGPSSTNLCLGLASLQGGRVPAASQPQRRTGSTTPPRGRLAPARCPHSAALGSRSGPQERTQGQGHARTGCGPACLQPHPPPPPPPPLLCPGSWGGLAPRGHQCVWTQDHSLCIRG